MCDYFDDFDGEFMEDGFDDDMGDSMDPDLEDDPDHEDEQNDGLSWSEAYWSGVGLGWFYVEGKRKRRRKKELDTNNPPDID
jgi:hypothetical protein